MKRIAMVMDREKIRLALSIVSGRKQLNRICHDELEILGYDSYKFSAFGRPSDADIKEKAESILFDAITTSLERSTCSCNSPDC